MLISNIRFKHKKIKESCNFHTYLLSFKICRNLVCKPLGFQNTHAKRKNTKIYTSRVSKQKFTGKEKQHHDPKDINDVWQNCCKFLHRAAIYIPLPVLWFTIWTILYHSVRSTFLQKHKSPIESKLMIWSEYQSEIGA